jgi:hypothetical protein
MERGEKTPGARSIMVSGGEGRRKPHCIGAPDNVVLARRRLKTFPGGSARDI